MEKRYTYEKNDNVLFFHVRIPHVTKKNPQNLRSSYLERNSQECSYLRFFLLCVYVQLGVHYMENINNYLPLQKQPSSSLKKKSLVCYQTKHSSESPNEWIWLRNLEYIQNDPILGFNSSTVIDSIHHHFYCSVYFSDKKLP